MPVVQSLPEPRMSALWGLLGVWSGFHDAAPGREKEGRMEEPKRLPGERDESP